MNLLKPIKLVNTFVLGSLFFFQVLNAQNIYPNKPIRLVVDSVPGGTTDLLGRIAAYGMAQQFGTSIVVDNKAGATGNLAMDYVMKQSPIYVFWPEAIFLERLTFLNNN